MKRFICRTTIILGLFFIQTSLAQYTDLINSNRPSESIGAFSVGKDVVQFEMGHRFESYKHKSFNDSKVFAYNIDFAVRYGFWREQFEISWETSYQFDQFTDNTSFPTRILNRNGFYRNTIGAKYLFFDPFRKYQLRSEEEKAEDKKDIDLYSWKANNKFRWRDIIPAVSVYVGFNIGGSNTYPYRDMFNDISLLGFNNDYEEPFISPKITLAAQSHFLPTWVAVANITYDRIGTDFPELSYLLTVTKAFHPRWSVYLENQGISSDIYSDVIFRGGGSYLFWKNIQIDASIGTNLKNSPSRVFGNLGISYRLDYHEDEPPNFDKYKRQLDRTKKKEKQQRRKETRKKRKKEKRDKKKNKDKDSTPEDGGEDNEDDGGDEDEGEEN